MRLTRGHFYHHGRFYAAVVLGLAAYAAMRLARGPAPLAAGGDAFFVSYLVLSAAFLGRLTREGFRRRAAREDEGIVVVVTIAVAIIAINVAGIFIALNQAHPPTGLEFALVVAAAPLGWFVLHTISAFHYANLHYFDPPGDAEPGKALVFPGTPTPDVWDFFYFSFVIGMTAQVSDVQVCTSGMRKAVTGHSIVSFFFNTVLIALVVNAIVSGH
ncbi:MAG TPA: DUF1345 domain-containing protein [Rhizomicrobium sp.]|nr:DUF1345 domain-containing protein [Rhizomicrobium sp.]